MLPFLRLDPASVLAPVVIKGLALVAIIGLGVYLGIKYEKGNTQEVKLAWEADKLKRANQYNADLLEANEKAAAAAAEVEKLNGESHKREAKRNAEYDSLLARYNAERVRVKSTSSKTKGGVATNTGQCESTTPEGVISHQAGEDIISLVSEADIYLNSLRDAQVYIATIKKLCE